MALTIKKLRNIADGPADEGGKRMKIQIGTIALDNSYPTNGEAFDLSADFDTLHMVMFDQPGAIILLYDYSAKKVKAFWGDYTASAVGVHVEVGNTTDLSGYTGI